LDRQTVVQVRFPDSPGLLAHGHNGRQASSGKKVASHAGEQDRQWNHQRKSLSHGLKKFSLPMKRLQDHQNVVSVRERKSPGITAVLVAAKLNVLKGPRRLRRAVDQFAKNIWRAVLCIFGRQKVLKRNDAAAIFVKNRKG